MNRRPAPRWMKRRRAISGSSSPAMLKPTRAKNERDRPRVNGPLFFLPSAARELDSFAGRLMRPAELYLERAVHAVCNDSILRGDVEVRLLFSIRPCSNSLLWDRFNLRGVYWILLGGRYSLRCRGKKFWRILSWIWVNNYTHQFCCHN